MSKLSIDRNIQFLFEVGSLRHLLRTWHRFLWPHFADNISEHTFRVIWIAISIAKMEKNVDEEKLIKMALVHDIAESRSGDADYVSSIYCKRDEEQGIKDMLKDTVVEKEFLKLIDEYEERKSKEAKIVKDADNLDVDFVLAELFEMGNQMVPRWRKLRKGVIRNNLYTNSAKKIYDKLQISKPADWHILGKNRFTANGWKR